MARSNQHGKTTAAGLRARAGHTGFTLIEIVVAVGAVALVAVGLASIFDSVGKTVTGGRRLSVLNTYGSLIESQMRRDFEAMTRDGFLVIRQQWVDSGATPDGTITDPPPASNSPRGTADTVPLSPTSATARPRRIDEIMFFTKGKFTSARQPVLPGVQPSAEVARVYYGHGQVVPVLSAGNASYPEYRKPFPTIDDGRANGATRTDMAARAAAGLGQAPYNVRNPNAFASNWTLLRQVTALTSPPASDTAPVPPTPSVFGLDPRTPQNHDILKDKYTQVALQPAQSSIFRAVATYFPQVAVMPEATLRYYSDNNSLPVPPTQASMRYPMTSTGLVDVASTNLDEIRAMVTSARDFAGQPAWPDLLTNPTTQLPLTSARVFVPARVGTPAAGLTGSGIGLYPTRPVPNQYDAVDQTEAWMSDAMPTDSRNAAAVAAQQDFAPGIADTMGARVRYEPDATDVFASISRLRDGTAISTTMTDVQKLQMSEDRADQLMLSASNFVPHCSEFIVEWSYGEVDGAGLIVWHGPNRRTDTNSDGKIDQNDGVAVRPYPLDMFGTGHVHATKVGYLLDANGAIVPAPSPGANREPVGQHWITDRLIYGFSPTGNESCLTSYFGWTDPTYDPSFVPSPLPGGAARYVNTARGPLPWSWPRMVRVTMTLSDPIDSEIETTFQYVFNTPQDPGSAGASKAGATN